MLRFEGEVFLFGTAMEAPVLESDYKKIGDDRCLFNGEAPRRRPDRRERRSYSETASERKAVGVDSAQVGFGTSCLLSTHCRH